MSKFFWTLFKGPLIQRCSSSAVYTPKNIFFRPFFVFSLLLPFSMLKNAFKKYPPQNRTNVQIKGGGGSKAFWTMLKKTALFWNGGIPKHKMNEYVNFFLIWWPKLIMDEKYLKIQMIKGPGASVRDVEVWVNFLWDGRRADDIWKLVAAPCAAMVLDWKQSWSDRGVNCHLDLCIPEGNVFPWCQ